jgi:hypothetical protein
MVPAEDGLPATVFALNDQQLYWARANSSGVYTVDLAMTQTLIVVSETAASVSSISALSPGQQIIPGEWVM